MKDPRRILDGVWPRFSGLNATELSKEFQYEDEVSFVTDVSCRVLDKARTSTLTWHGHVADFLLVAFVILMFAIFVYVSRQSFPHGKSELVVAVVAGGIPRFHVITLSDISVQAVPTVDGSLGHIEEVLGHYPVENIPVGTVVRSNQLSSGMMPPGALSNRVALLLPLKSTGLVSKSLPVRMALYIPQRPAKDPLVFNDVYLLYVSATQDGATVAVTQADARLITNSLGTMDTYMAEPIR